MAIRILSVVVLLVLFASTVSAQQMFKWKDKKGQWHFSDTPPPGVTAEKVRGLDISPKSSPATSPYSKPSVSSPAGSGSKEKAVSKLPAERPSNVSRRDLTSRWLLLLPNENLLKSFDNAEACERYKGILTSRSMQQGFTSYTAPIFYARSRCILSDALELSKEANVVIVNTEVMRDQKRATHHFLSGTVFNRGRATAKNVVVKYQIRNNRGTTITRGEIPASPKDIPGGKFGEFRSRISSIGMGNRNIHTEADWSKN